MQQQAMSSDANVLSVLNAAFREYAVEEGRGPFELRTQPTVAHDPAATLDLAEKTAHALKSAEQRIEQLEARREELVCAIRAEMERVQAAGYVAERRAAQAERLAEDAEEKARQSLEWLSQIQEMLKESLRKPASRGPKGNASTYGRNVCAESDFASPRGA